MIAALRASANIVTAAAQKLHISRQTLHEWIADEPELQEAREQIKEELLDLAESGLVTAIRNGSEKSIHYYLDRQGQSRGYTPRKDIGGVPGNPVGVKPDLAGLSTSQLQEHVAALSAAAAALAAAQG